jgi:hypothetical protein
MANTQLNDGDNTRIQGILARYLELHSADLPNDLSGHFDEDSLNLFVEGRLSERESTPMITHLTDCSFCRHRTAELVRLAFYFDEQDEPSTVAAKTSEPVSVSSVLSGILSRIFGTADSAVFAHEEKDDESKSGDDKDREPKE